MNINADTGTERAGTIDSSFVEIDIAGERALGRSFNGTRMIFGLGPPRGGAAPAERLQHVLTSLEPQVRSLRWGRQIHGNIVASIATEGGRPFTGTVCVGRCDALMTAEPSTGLAVWTADCVPVLLEGDGVVAAVHSGWRGTAADIIGKVVRRFEIEFGVPSDRLQAALGPAISGPHYEVGPEVVRALKNVGGSSEAWRHGDRVDLRDFLSLRLRHLGLKTSSVSVIGPCTASSAHLASYRRDGVEAGRQFSLIYREEPPFSSEDEPVFRDRRPRN